MNPHQRMIHINLHGHTNPHGGSSKYCEKALRNGGWTVTERRGHDLPPDNVDGYGIQELARKKGAPIHRNVRCVSRGSK